MGAKDAREGESVREAEVSVMEFEGSAGTDEELGPVDEEIVLLDGLGGKEWEAVGDGWETEDVGLSVERTTKDGLEASTALLETFLARNTHNE